MAIIVVVTVIGKKMFAYELASILFLHVTLFTPPFSKCLVAYTLRSRSRGHDPVTLDRGVPTGQTSVPHLDIDG